MVFEISEQTDIDLRIDLYTVLLLNTLSCRVALVGRVDSAFDSHLKDTGSNPVEADHCVTTVG